MTPLAKTLLIAGALLAILITVGVADYIAGVLQGLEDYYYARGDELANDTFTPFRFPRVGPEVDDFVARLLGASMAFTAMLLLFIFEVYAHERER